MTAIDLPIDPPTPSADPASGAERSALDTLTLAAVCSVGSGLVHAAAAGTHSGDTTLVWLFATTAALQLGWAVLVLSRPRPSRTVIAAGVVLNLAIALGWLLSRTTGLPVVDSLGAREAVGVQDALATGLELGAVVLAAVSWRRPLAVPRAAFLGFVAVTLVPTLLGMTAAHSHTGSHDHEHGTTGEDEVATHSDAHEHADDGEGSTGSSTTAPHEHDAAGADGTTTTPHDHAEEGAADEVDPVFAGADVTGIPAAQLEDAAALVENTRAAVAAAGYTDVASVEAAGYVSIGDGRRRTGVVYEHFINPAYLHDGNELDPQHVESLVFEVTDGVKQLTTAMYVLETGSTMADVPDIAGSLTMWHDHQNLCWDESGTRLAGVARNGACVPAGTLRPTPPMLHVWLDDHECGPFAGVEGHATASQASCSAAHSHD